MVGDKGKKLKVGERDEDENAEHIDRDLVISIEKLQEIQEELEKINEEASDKVLEVEQKYNEIRKPIYDKRNDIIKFIPDFWLTAFVSHPAFLLTEEDQKIFKYLSSLEVEDFKDVKSGYSITFNFKPNPYFEDTKLTKSFTFLDEGTTTISATPIKWKDGNGILDGVAHEKNRSKRSHAEESFFSWFSDIDDIQDEVAELIKEDLWTNPLNFFSNDADEEAFDEEEDDEEDDDDDNDNEGDDEDGN
ncbi:NAP1-related protein 2-like isoform X2 [Actinidia eriantha]|uniref:NAP1-related protein 2-like isoform X2 n=1 Tax=Actinidia eriantha TaxID=165200 RepID=UPI002588C009|nr:NAP1-related protein 2-like isoform X2 [Actinidia eriantha]XP_057465554.1 NAP1-related protein 2-like isoform X2 [Actinidia eriantha]